MPGRDPRAKPPRDSNCPGCKHFRSRDDWEHNRVIGELCYPHDEPVIPECDACQRRVARYAAGHTYEAGKCRWAAAQVRTSGGRARGPQTQAHAEPTAGAPAQIDGRELGDEGDREAAQPAPAPAASSSASGSSGPPAPAPLAPADPSGSQSTEPGGGRGPDQQPRVRRVFRDAGDNPEQPHDWTNFDIGRVVRLFRTNREAAIRLSLRKLHVRWWHASEHTMKRFLGRVGVAQTVLDLIPEICQTCRVCREWTKPAPGNVCSTEIADTFNQQVESTSCSWESISFSTCWTDALDGMQHE